MELKLNRKLDTADVFWTVGDVAFQFIGNDGAISASDHPVGRLAGFAANLNYNLLMHDRLVLTDTSLLLNPALLGLLQREPGCELRERIGAELLGKYPHLQRLKWIGGALRWKSGRAHRWRRSCQILR